jgi:hypothetical protein
VAKIWCKRKENYRKNGLVGQIVLELMSVRFFGQKFGDSEEKSGYKIHFFRCDDLFLSTAIECQ